MIQALSGTDIGRAVQCICGSTYICPPVQTLLFVVKLSGSTVMFPLDSNLDTFSLCREACRGALVPSCQPPSWCASSHVTCSFFASPEPLSCQLLLPGSGLSSGVRTVQNRMCLEHRISSAILHSYSINCPLRVTQLPLSRLWISQACLVWFW